MSVGPDGGQGPQPGRPGPWPPPPGNTPQWQYPGPPPGGGRPPPPGPEAPGGPAGLGGPGGPGGPPPSGGLPPWGGPSQPYGFGPPPKKGRGGVIVAVVGGLVALVVLVVVVVALGGSGDDPKKTSGKAANKAGQNLGQAAGLNYTGAYGSGQATFSVTKAGSAQGSYTSQGSPVSRVDIGDATYIKANSSYWTSHGLSPTSAGTADGTWTRAPDTSIDLKLADLSPAKLARILEQAGNDPDAEKTPVGSTPAIKMTINEVTYYISRSEPRRLLRIEGSAGSEEYALNVTALPASAMSPVFSQLRDDVQDLGDAYDPQVTILPMSKKFGSCTEPGCTVHSSVMPSVMGGSTTTVRITMNARFWGDGPTVATCSGSGSTVPGRETTITCRTSGGSWSSWYHSHKARFTIHANATFEAKVNSSSDVNALLSKLTQEQQSG
ncbi:MAG: hypothetical protein JWR24_2978 [Actinoallomurus sp.]|nr:hypothetical protein [Actinoallomurus sp.]